MDKIDEIQSLKKKYNQKTNIYLDELSRKSKGTSANSISNEFVQLKKDGPIFFISSNGFKRMYMNDGETPHKSCIQYHLNEPKVSETDTLYQKYSSKRPIQSGEPCGFEEKLVGLKSTNGTLFTRIGYINQDGELEEYLETKIKDVKKCSSSIIEIDNDTWNAFLKSSVNKDGTPCESTYKNKTRKELEQTQHNMNDILEDMSKEMQDLDDVKDTNQKENLFKKSNELKSKKKILTRLKTKWNNMDGLYSSLNENKMFFLTRLKWIVALLLFLVVIMYLLYRTFRNVISYAIPESLKSSIQDITNNSLNTFTSNSNETILDEEDDSTNDNDTNNTNDNSTAFENMLSSVNNTSLSEIDYNQTMDEDSSGNEI